MYSGAAMMGLGNLGCSLLFSFFFNTKNDTYALAFYMVLTYISWLCFGEQADFLTKMTACPTWEEASLACCLFSHLLPSLLRSALPQRACLPTSLTNTIVMGHRSANNASLGVQPAKSFRPHTHSPVITPTNSQTRMLTSVS